MKLYNILYESCTKLSKKEIFIAGFYISFLLILFLASILDYLIADMVDFYIDVALFVLTLVSAWYFKQSRSVEIASYFIVFITTLGSYIFLVTNDFGVSVFHTMVPLGYFLLFSLRRSLFLVLIHTSIVVVLYLYAYQAYPDNVALHHPPTLVSLAIASLLMIFFGIVYHFSMENSYAKLDKSNRQKEILLQEVHHRVKNNLNIISSMLGLQMLREKDTTVKQVFQKNRLRVDSIAMVHEILYQHSDFETIDVHEYLDSLSSMVCEMSDEHIGIHLKDKVLALPFEMVLKIGILTNELIVNTIKHASNEKSKQIFIGFHDEGEYYRYIYQDSGTQKVDMEKLNNAKTLGLKLIHLMVEQLEATLDLSGDRGLVYSIRIPKHV